METQATHTNITIIIKDKKFETTRELLSKYSEYFENLFTECGRDITNELTLDGQDPVAFDHMLAYFNDITYEIPEKYNKSLKFYLIKERLIESIKMYEKNKNDISETKKRLEFLENDRIQIESTFKKEFVRKAELQRYIYIVEDKINPRQLLLDGKKNKSTNRKKIFLSINYAQDYYDNVLKSYSNILDKNKIKLTVISTEIIATVKELIKNHPLEDIDTN